MNINTYEQLNTSLNIGLTVTTNTICCHFYFLVNLIPMHAVSMEIIVFQYWLLQHMSNLKHARHWKCVLINP